VIFFLSVIKLPQNPASLKGGLKRATNAKDKIIAGDLTLPQIPPHCRFIKSVQKPMG
jgi:hypothetical protein